MLRFIYFYLIAGFINVIIYWIDNAVDPIKRSRFKPNGIYNELMNDKELIKTPNVSAIIQIFGNPIGMSILYLLMWPHDLYKLIKRVL